MNGNATDRLSKDDIVLSNFKMLASFEIGDKPVTSGRLLCKEERKHLVDLRRAITHAFNFEVITNTFEEAVRIQNEAKRMALSYGLKTKYLDTTDKIGNLAEKAFQGLKNLEQTYIKEKKIETSRKFEELHSKYYSLIVTKKKYRPVSEIISSMNNEPKPTRSFGDLQKFWQSNQTVESKPKVVPKKESYFSVKESLAPNVKYLSEPALPKPRIEFEEKSEDNEKITTVQPNRICGIIATINTEAQEIKSLEDDAYLKSNSTEILKIARSESVKEMTFSTFLKEFYASELRPSFSVKQIESIQKKRREQIKKDEVKESGFNLSLIDKIKKIGSKTDEDVPLSKPSKKEKVKKIFNVVKRRPLPQIPAKSKETSKIIKEVASQKIIYRSISMRFPNKNNEVLLSPDLIETLKKRRQAWKDEDSEDELSEI